MGVDSKEYGRLTDIAYSSSHGYERAPAAARPTKARKLLQKMAKNAWKKRSEKEAKVNGAKRILDRQPDINWYDKWRSELHKLDDRYAADRRAPGHGSTDDY